MSCSGAKWHYAPMAKQLAQAGVLTCVLQYSLYPEALAPEMVDELSQALTWTFNNINQHGGNPNQVAHASAPFKHSPCSAALCDSVTTPQVPPTPPPHPPPNFCQPCLLDCLSAA